MTTEYLQADIDRFKKAIEEDEKEIAVINQRLKYNKKQLKNAENTLAEIQEIKEDANTETP
jgi:peptidoglycan hydrolase CwlO-like protein